MCGKHGWGGQGGLGGQRGQGFQRQIDDVLNMNTKDQWLFIFFFNFEYFIAVQDHHKRLGLNAK